MYADDPLTMLCGAIATMRLALVIPALQSSGSQIGEWRMEAGRVGPKREFWTPRVLSTLTGVKIEIIDWRFEIFRIEIQSEMWHGITVHSTIRILIQ